jgi:hypothetical protein
MTANPIDAELARQITPVGGPIGPIARMARGYSIDSDRLLGLLLKLDFAECHLVTCDAWKRNCGGIPRGSFLIFRIDPRAVNVADRHYSDRLILARVTDAVPTPVETNVQQTLFQAHKLQAQLDPLTHQDLAWGALKASVVGTFYDADGEIAFGNDVDTFFSPFTYVAYSPTAEDLTLLVNAFVRCEHPVEIGRLRYTETPSPHVAGNVPIFIDPRDLVGEPTSAQRLANFGKTRFGKSNANKIIAQAVFTSGLDVAQVFFDPSGEYTYINDQDGTSLFAQFHNRAIRYSLSPRALRDDEQALGLMQPQLLRINFYAFQAVGHALIIALWNTENTARPGYMVPLLEWLPTEQEPNRQDRSAFNHYWRTMGMYFALLFRAGFTPPPNLRVPITFRDRVKQELQTIPGVALNQAGEFVENGQPIAVLPAIYRSIARLHSDHRGDPAWFPPSPDGQEYFNDLEQKLLRMLSDDTIVAHNYLRPFAKYHSPDGVSIFDDITTAVANGQSVFIDMSQSPEMVRNNLVERICRTILHRQNQRFNSQEGVGNRFVMLYFEEAHRLFNKDDSDLNSVYNLIAKEGAKLNIAMVYATQSMTTVSPDLIKNTDNFLIAHLDDDREVKEVTRKYVFRDVAEDVQRVQSKGFVRLITRSHRFALPVQLARFQVPEQSRE